MLKRHLEIFQVSGMLLLAFKRIYIKQEQYKMNFGKDEGASPGVCG